MNESYNQFVDKARNFACGIYKNFPGALVPKPTDAGYKHIWDDLCYEPPPSDLPGLPLPPVPPFSGGQCCNLAYKVVTTSTNDGGVTYFDYELPGVYFGKILGIVQKKQSDNAGGVSVSFDLQWEDCAGNVSSERQGLSPDNGQVRIVVKSVRPAYGQLDNCGSPPKKYPDAPPIPPGGYKSPPTIINFNDGDENNFIFNFYPPQKSDFPDTPFPPIAINVGGVDNDLNFDINFNFGGDVNFSNPGTGGDLPPALNNKFQNLSGGVSSLGGGLAGVKENLDFIFTPPSFFDSPKVEVEEKDIVDGGGEDDNKEGLLGVLVELTEPAKEIIFGTPNVHFAGWLTFLTQGGYTPRDPINFERSYFPAPEGATGYALTFTKGAKGKITVFSKSDN